MNADVHPTPADRVTNWNYEADVIVAGSGGGLVGAYTAAREGLSVMVVEATDEFGGTTAYSGGGGMWFPCNPALQRAGSDDTLDAAFAYFHAAVEAASASADVLVLERTGGWGRRLGPWSDRGNASRERIGMVAPRLRSA